MTESFPADPAQRAATALAEAARRGAQLFREVEEGPRAEAWDTGRAVELDALAERFDAAGHDLAASDSARRRADDQGDALRAALKAFEAVHDLGHGALAVLRLLGRAADRTAAHRPATLAREVDAAFDALFEQARRRAAELDGSREQALRILASQRDEATALVARLTTPLPPNP